MELQKITEDYEEKEKNPAKLELQKIIEDYEEEKKTQPNWSYRKSLTTMETTPPPPPRPPSQTGATENH